MKKKLKVVGYILLSAAVVCVAVGIFQYVQERKARERYEELRQEVKNTQSEKEAEPTPEVQVTEAPQTPEIPIDFAALQQVNPDVYAWITIPGTAIDYPVLQHPEDNSYYLNHTIDNKESPEGAIYTENYNSKDFQDANTVIYGHDMKDGSMFQNLLLYQDRSFFAANRTVWIYTPDAIRQYKIFAAYVYDNRHLLQSFDFSDERVFGNYLEGIFSMRSMEACIDTSMEVGSENQIITLSTCCGDKNYRYLVQAVLVSIEQ